MIYFGLFGGLGNQFFQYAFAKKAYNATSDSVMLLTEYFYRFDAIREPSIKKFNISIDYQEKKDFNYLDNRKFLKLRIKTFKKVTSFFENLGLNKLTQKAMTSFQKRLYKKGMFIELDIKNPMFPSVYPKKDKYLEGMWHNPAYFDDIKDELVKEFVLKDTSVLPENLTKEIDKGNSVCVHIRRGDYLLYDYYMVCDADYYIRAIDKMREMHKGAKFFIFSDDIEWVKANIPSSEDIVYVEEKNPDYVDFELMRRCSHFIISNSTFSWWAAYLGQADNKTVMTPDKWYTNGKNKEQLNLPDWVVMKTGI